MNLRIVCTTNKAIHWHWLMARCWVLKVRMRTESQDFSCFSGQTAKPSAYTQADLGGEETWVSLPKTLWPDSWNKFKRPVCRLKFALYGHPLIGVFSETKISKGKWGHSAKASLPSAETWGLGESPSISIRKPKIEISVAIKKNKKIRKDFSNVNQLIVQKNFEKYADL